MLRYLLISAKIHKIVCESNPQIGGVSFTGDLQTLHYFLNTGAVSSFQYQAQARHAVLWCN